MASTAMPSGGRAALRHLLPPAGVVVLGAAIDRAALWLAWRDATDAAARLATGVGEALTVIGAAWFVARGVDVVLSRRFARANRVPPRLVGELVRVVVFGVALLALAARLAGQSVGGVLATSGVLIAIVGFSLRHTLTDIVSGIALGIEAPFRIGDWIALADGTTGRVEEISWRASRIVTKDGVAVTVPNGLVAGQVLRAYSRPEPHYRASAEIELPPDVPADRAIRILQGALLRTETICARPEPDVVIDGPGEGGIRYRLRWWVGGYAEDVPCRDAVLRHAFEDLHRAGLAPAAPRRAHLPLAAEALAEDDMRRRLLADAPFFGAFDEEERDRLATAMRRTAVPAGADAVVAGHQGRTLYLVAEGILDVLKRHEGDDVRVDRMVPGDVFGEMALLTGEPRSATVRAVLPSVLFALEPEDVEPLLRRRPERADRLASLMAERLAHNRAQLAAAAAAAPGPSPATAPAGLADRVRRIFGIGPAET